MQTGTSPRWTIIQAGIALVAMIGLAFTPPTRGRMMVVPFTARAATGLPKAAIGGGALLLGAGPVKGSLIVIADRDRLGGFADGLIVLSAPALFCSAAAARAA